MLFNTYDPRQGKIYQVMNEAGELAKGAPLPSDAMLKQFYRDMVRLRAIDDKAFNLQRQGRLNTYPQIKGHEAIQVSAAHAMKPQDWLVPSYREGALAHLRGVPFYQVLLFWFGNEMGSHFPQEAKVLPFSIPIASHLPHAVGIGWGAKLRKENLAVVATFGDGATSEGEFHEAMNFAGVYKAPVVFLCTNNQWAISVSREMQTASQTLAEKAFGYGFHGIAVDGMDILAMYQVMTEALEKARCGEGPTFIEAVTYRLCDHTTADDASIYQCAEDVAMWKEKDGVLRLRRFLEKKGLWQKKDDEEIQQQAQVFVEETVHAFETYAKPTPEEIFNFTFAETSPRLREQLEDAKVFASEVHEENYH